MPDPQTAAVILQHVNAGPAIGGIGHQVHGAVWLEHGPQGAQPRVGIGQVVQHARTHNLVETAAQLAHPLDGQLIDVQIGQMIFTLERLGMTDARLADVDADHLASGLAQGVFGRLRGPAAGDKD